MDRRLLVLDQHDQTGQERSPKDIYQHVRRRRLVVIVQCHRV